jgi:hypothetical protein
LTEQQQQQLKIYSMDTPENPNELIEGKNKTLTTGVEATTPEQVHQAASEIDEGGPADVPIR